MGAPKQVLRTLFLNNQFWVGENIRQSDQGFLCGIAGQADQTGQSGQR